MGKNASKGKIALFTIISVLIIDQIGRASCRERV